MSNMLPTRPDDCEQWLAGVFPDGTIELYTKDRACCAQAAKARDENRPADFVYWTGEDWNKVFAQVVSLNNAGPGWLIGLKAVEANA